MQVADQLGLSVRSIEGYVYRTCARLGLSNGRKLAALVTETAAAGATLMAAALLEAVGHRCAVEDSGRSPGRPLQRQPRRETAVSALPRPRIRAR